MRATPEDEPTASELLTAVDAALAGVDLDYHDPFYEDVDDGVQGIEEAVDELERHLDGGAHPVVRRGLQHPLTRLGDLARDADNADALLEVAERASTLLGRAVAGHPDPLSLARWLVGYRVEYGGWPSLALDAVAPVFDEPAWDAYRASAATWGGGGPGADPYRSEIDRMPLELADRDGDVERAVGLLSRGDEPYYREILRRLRERLTVGWLPRMAEPSRHPGRRGRRLAGGTHRRARRGSRRRLTWTVGVRTPPSRSRGPCWTATSEWTPSGC